MVWRIIPLVLLAACPNDASTAGTAGAPCRPDGTCYPSLACLAGICVQSPDAGWLDLGRPLPDGPTGKGDLFVVDLVHPVDLPHTSDKGPSPDKGPSLDQGPKPDKGFPAGCLQWSGWSCIAAPQPKVVCWATCPGSAGAIWCDGGGNCYCTSAGPGNCATSVPIDLSKPCDACKAALQVHGCCLP